MRKRVLVDIGGSIDDLSHEHAVPLNSQVPGLLILTLMTFKLLFSR